MSVPYAVSISRAQVGLVTLISVKCSPITSRPTNSRPRRFSSGPTDAAISRSRAVSGRASPRPPADRLPRSGEHTSELQPLMRISYALFRLKKQNHQQSHPPEYKIQARGRHTFIRSQQMLSHYYDTPN